MGCARGLALDVGARLPAVADRLGGILSGGGSAPLGALGNAELPGRGLVELVRCGNVFDRCGKDDMVVMVAASSGWGCVGGWSQPIACIRSR